MAGDVARMELLLALSDLSDAPGAGTTLSQMRSVLSELTRSVRALELSRSKPGGKIHGSSPEQVHRRICGCAWSGN